MRFALPLLVCLLTALPANSEPMNFAVYRLTGMGLPSDGRILIAKGRLDYSLEDIDVVKWGNHEGNPTWKKSLALAMGFRIGMLVAENDETPGFGLWIQNDHHPAGFSWEWFYLEEGDTFKKLQGEGRVRVSQFQDPDGVEVQSIEFLTDITLRFQEDVTQGPGHVTHEIVVSKGSVFRVAS
jgi:hypothetical protein